MLVGIILLASLLANSNAFFKTSTTTAKPTVAPAASTLKLVHAVFRHGNRNPDVGSLWLSNPYINESNYPEGYGQLVNAGKTREYELGQLLRQRYGFFLGEEYKKNLLDVRSSNYDRTKMSLELVLAGLFPPKGDNVWNDDLTWQPIPFNYVPNSEDTLINPWSACPNYQGQLQAALESPEVLNYLESRYGDLMTVLSQNTGIGLDDFYIAWGYFFGALVQEQLGIPLEKWTEQVYPEPWHSLAVDFYYVNTNTTALRQIMSGFLLKKILSDTLNAINGEVSSTPTKMYLYSGHELNVGSMILSLEAFRLVDIPAYGSTVLFEVHEIDSVYGIKRLAYGISCSSGIHQQLINELLTGISGTSFYLSDIRVTGKTIRNIMLI